MPEQLPVIELGAHPVSRLILGGNPMCGLSHYSEARHQQVGDSPQGVGAGRVQPKEGIGLALRLCKPNDCLVIGLGFPGEIEQKAALVGQILSRAPNGS